MRGRVAWTSLTRVFVNMLLTQPLPSLTIILDNFDKLLKLNNFANPDNSHHLYIFSCPQQLNRTHCPLLAWLVCLLPLTIRVFTTLQSDPRDLWLLRHLIRQIFERLTDFWKSFLNFGKFSDFCNNNSNKDNPKTCDIWDTNYNSDNWEPEVMTIFVIWQLIVTLDTIRNSCDVL